jgi:hypothetical protein
VPQGIAVPQVTVHQREAIVVRPAGGNRRRCPDKTVWAAETPLGLSLDRSLGWCERTGGPAWSVVRHSGAGRDQAVTGPGQELTMNVTSRAARRVAGGLALAGVAALLPVGALAAPARPAMPAAAPACTGGHTQVWVGLPGDGTAGTTFYQLEFSNIGPAPCTMLGFPGVSMIRANGHQAGLGARRTGTAHRVTLAPGATAHAILGVTDAGAVCSHPARTVTVRVFPPGQRRAQFVPLALEACLHHSVLRVRPVRQGTGIPGFTIR